MRSGLSGLENVALTLTSDLHHDKKVDMISTALPCTLRQTRALEVIEILKRWEFHQVEGYDDDGLSRPCSMSERVCCLEVLIGQIQNSHSV